MLYHPHIHFGPNVKTVPTLIEQVKQKGGKLVIFQRVTSLIVVSWENTHLEWVPSYSTRFGVGARYTLWTMFLGWWSLPGLFSAPTAILNNLLGGIDVTELVDAAPPLPGKPPAAIIKAQHKLRQRFYYAVLIEFVALLVAIALWLTR